MTGPSTIFKAYRSNYITSSFQCFIQFLLNVEVTNNDKHFKFYGRMSNVIKLRFKAGSERNLTLPTSDCELNRCFIELSTDPGFYFNISLINLTLNSTKFSHLSFQGVHVLEVQNRELLTLLSVTQHIRTKDRLYERSYYTQSSFCVHNCVLVQGYI